MRTSHLLGVAALSLLVSACDQTSSVAEPRLTSSASVSSLSPALARHDAIGDATLRPAISGPSFSYASAGGATWTVSGSGGTAPYTFHWYVQDERTGVTLDVGTGTSYSNYPGEGPHMLTVTMTDANGHWTTTSYETSGIGDGNGGCDPLNPWLVC